jgi:hypothetical protein
MEQTRYTETKDCSFVRVLLYNLRLRNVSGRHFVAMVTRNCVMTMINLTLTGKIYKNPVPTSQ